MIKKPSLYQILTGILGFALILLSFLVDLLQWGGEYASTGFGKTQWILLFAGIVIFIISLCGPKASKVAFINACVLFSLLLFMDNMLYLMVDKWPPQISEILSAQAQARLAKLKSKSPSDDKFIFDPDRYMVFYGRPNVGDYDELGYRNPPGYISRQKRIDVLLVGDSFVEGVASAVTMADYLRDSLQPKTVYSLGIQGQGTAQWYFQLKNFYDSPHYKHPPEVVILHYYGGNDAKEARAFAYGQTYYNRIYFSFFRELKNLFSYFVFFKHAPERKIYFKNDADELLISGNMDKNIKLLEVDEEALDKNDILVLNGLKAAENAIRSQNPKTRIILAYIPTTNSCYKEDYSDYRTKSEILRQWSREMGFEYIDPIETLRARAKEKPIHASFDSHFSEEGYKLYAEILRTKIIQQPKSIVKPNDL